MLITTTNGIKYNAIVQKLLFFFKALSNQTVRLLSDTDTLILYSFGVIN
jgi:hypothetical protein